MRTAGAATSTQSPAPPWAPPTAEMLRAREDAINPLVMDDRRSFAEILSIADRGPLAKAPTAREAAESFVALALVQPLLAEARQSSWAAPPFAPTQAEKQFGALMDAHVAREITRAARFPLVEGLAQRMRGK